MADSSGTGDFAALAPDAVMDCAERATGRRASGVCRKRIASVAAGRPLRRVAAMAAPIGA